MLDLESEAMRGLSSIPIGDNILSLDFFHVVRASDANIGIIGNLVFLWKKPITREIRKFFFNVIIFA